MRDALIMRKVEMLQRENGRGCVVAIVIYPTRATGVFPRPPVGGLARVRAGVRVRVRGRVGAQVGVRVLPTRARFIHGRQRFQLSA